MTELTAPPLASPFKGLAPFDDSDRDATLFFGREREREIIAANLMAYRLTVLYGVSGVGKSSVLRAGVVHHLRRTAEENRERLGHPQLAIVAFDSWSGDPVAGLLASVRRSLVDLFGDERVAEPSENLGDSLAAWSEELECELYLVLDQIDEYFLYHDEDEDFVLQFADAATREGLRVNFLLSIREDMLARLDRFKGRIPNLFSNYLRLDHLDREAARAAIVGPVGRYDELVEPELHVAIEPALVEAVLDQTVAGRVRLDESEAAEERVERPGRVEAPYLQLVMRRLWDEEERAESRILRLDTLERLGGATEIVRTHLGAALEALSPGEQDLAETLFNYLVTPSGTKIAHGLGDLAEYAAVPERAVLPVLSALVEERIVRPVTEGGDPDGSRYEIYHDVLAEPVAAWRAKHAADRRLAQERRAGERRHRRMLAVTVVSLVAVALMALVTVFALAQRREAQRQRGIAQSEETTVESKNEQLRVKNEQVAQKNQQLETKNKNISSLARGYEDERNRAVGATKQVNNQRQKLKEKNSELNQKNSALQTTNDSLKEKKKELNDSIRALVFSRKLARERARIAREGQLRERGLRKSANQAKIRALAQEFVAKSEAELTDDPVNSVRFAIAAANTLPKLRGVDNALRTALVRMNVRSILSSAGKPVLVANYGSSGSAILVATAHEMRVYSTQRPIRRLRTIRVGSPIEDADISPDGRVVVAGSQDGFAREWSVATGSRLQLFKHAAAVRSVSVSADGKWLLTASNDRTARIWSLATGEPLHTFHESGPVWMAALSPDRSRVVTITGSRPFGPGGLWDVRADRLITRLPRAAGTTIMSAAFDPKSQLVVTTSRDHTAKIWSARTGDLRRTLTGSENPVERAAFSPNSDFVVAADGADGQARMYNAATGGFISEFTGHEERVYDASFNPDPTDKLILTTSEDRTARTWRYAGDPVSTLLGGDVRSAAWSPDGKSVVTGDRKDARLWNPSSGEPILRQLGTHGAKVMRVSLNASGSLAVSSGADNTARVWRVSGRPELIATLLHKGAVNDALFAGDRVITASNDGTAVIWFARSGARLHTLDVGAAVHALSVAPNLGLIATGGADGSVALWSFSGHRLWIHHGTDDVASAAFTRNGRLLVTAGKTAQVWRVSDGTLLHTLDGHDGPIAQVAVSPDGKYIATAAAGTDTTARLWSVRTGKPLGGPMSSRIPGANDGLTSLAFNPAGTLLVTTGKSGDVRLWKVPSGKEKHDLHFHIGAVSGAAFSHDGRWLATAGPGRVAVWNVAQGKRLLLLRPNVPGSFTSVAFSPRDFRVLAGTSPPPKGSKEGTVATYNCLLCSDLHGLVSLGHQRLQALKPVR